MNHFKISVLKSILRIVGCIACIVLSITALPMTAGIVFGVLFLLAEILGILEEVFDKRKEN